MPATLNRPAVACDFCEAPLTGGPDTYGGVGQTLCFDCFHEAVTDINEGRHAKAEAERRREMLTKRLKSWQSSLVDAEADLDHAREQVSTCTRRIQNIERELRGEDTWDKEPEDDE